AETTAAAYAATRPAGRVEPGSALEGRREGGRVVELPQSVTYSSRLAAPRQVLATPREKHQRAGLGGAMNPLNSIWGTITAGVVLAVLIGLVNGVDFSDLTFIVWVHVLAGIVWIGLLYYFNFVQVPALAAAASDAGGPGGSGISKYVAPRALAWFRWGAVVTWLTGAA